MSTPVCQFCFKQAGFVVPTLITGPSQADAFFMCNACASAFFSGQIFHDEIHKIVDLPEPAKEPTHDEG